MTITIKYLNHCRRDRLRAAFAVNIQFLGSTYVVQIIRGLQGAYQHHNSPRTNYTYSLHTLNYVTGISGLAAISIIKEAWNPGSLTLHENNYGQDGQGPRAMPYITHPSTNTPQ